MINSNWIFGAQCGLNFTPGQAPTPIGGVPMNTWEGCASISDSNGNLLFYTDGGKIWDANHNVVVSGLQGNSSSTQSAIITLDPANSDQYYVFTTNGHSGNNRHFNGGLLNVTTWNFTPLASLMTLPDTDGLSPVEKVTAISHENCKDFWVITLVQKAGLTSGSGDGIFRIFSVTAAGVTHVQDVPMNMNVMDYGYMRANSDGSLLAISNTLRRQIYVYNFDRVTGQIDIPGMREIITTSNSNYGLEFSASHQFLYYSEHYGGDIFQVDLNAASLTPEKVGSVAGQTGALQMGPDGIIYIARDNQDMLGAILSPDTAGTGCDVRREYLQLGEGGRSRLGLPNLISNFCGGDDNDCNCGGGCNGCNENAEADNETLIERAKAKTNHQSADTSCGEPFAANCDKTAVQSQTDFAPCFFFHWGDGEHDRIESHDTEVFYLTVCNTFSDVEYKGLRITNVRLVPNELPLEDLQIVPDRLIEIDCLAPCSCQTREFAIITRAKETTGQYELEVDYCYEEIIITSSAAKGTVKFPVEIVRD